MCNPLALAVATFAMSAGSAVAQHQQAKAQANIQTRLHEINQVNALRDMQQQMADAGARQLQEHQKASAEIEDRKRRALMDVSTANAAAADRGVSGFTMSALLAQVMGEAGRDTSRMETNRDWTLDQLERDKQGIRASTISRMNSSTPGIKPSKAALALQIGSSALNSYTGYKAGKFG